MRKRAKKEDIDRWRRNYWRRREDHSNKEMAKKLGINEGNLSAYGQGTKKTNGKPTNPGAEFIKNFYMEYPELPELHEGNETDSDTNKEGSGYPHEGHPLDKLEEPAQVYQMNWDESARLRDELFSKYKRDDEFLRTEYSKLTSIGQAAVNANQTVANAFDKMAESNLNLSRVVASYGK